jgi:micrococcal nuclease
MRTTRTARSFAICGLVFIAFAIVIYRNGHISAPQKVTISLAHQSDAPAEATVQSVLFVRVATSTVRVNATVTHVVDGDTLDAKRDGGDNVRIRFLGVNTPEVVDPRKPVECFGSEASAFSKSLLNGKRIMLKGDPQADERDKYGRLLRTVILEDGTDVNATLVANGYAQAYTGFPLDPLRKRQVISLQRDAKAEARGMWAPGACSK